jgi:hypothetical protein
LAQKSQQFSQKLPIDALASLAQKSCQFSPNLPSDASPLWLKRVAILVKICLVMLASLAHKRCQFSPNLPCDAHLFGSIEELGKNKNKKLLCSRSIESRFRFCLKISCPSTTKEMLKYLNKTKFHVLSTKRCSGPPSTVMCTLNRDIAQIPSVEAIQQ